MNSMQGRVALVTGGGRGVGRGIAKLLAQEGAAVAIDDLHRDEQGRSSAEKVADEIKAEGGKALALQEDISQSKSVQAMVEATVKEFGPIDTLVTCAGNVILGGFQDLSEEQWDSVVNIHLKGHYLCCKAVLPYMREKNSGSILTVASRGAFYNLPPSKATPWVGRKPSSAPYAAAKAGIMGMTVQLAIELWDTGINVNCLLPSADTQLFPGDKPRAIGGTPPTQSLNPDDIAPAAVFLCTPTARNLSGKMMYASGGDVVFFGDQLDMRGSRMVRKPTRWTVKELEDVLPSLLAVT